MSDGAECIINAALCAMREVFGKEAEVPPLGGGADAVRFFACEAPPLSAVDLHVEDCGCAQPFAWVRFTRRYPIGLGRFQISNLVSNPCGEQTAVGLELGIARCAALGADGNPPSWKELATEAEISLDDSWRIQLAQCRASAIMRKSGCSDMQSMDEVIPFGPDGGVLGWTANLYARIDT